MVQPVCPKDGREMQCIKNGVVCFHLYAHAKPGAVAQEIVNGVNVINTDVLIEGGWEDGDVDFVQIGDRLISG